jgi:hypothetical protein
MTESPAPFASILMDQALAAEMVPWACPCPFGPDGRYRLEELIAASPHALIYAATDTAMSSDGFDATVAIKILRKTQTTRHEALTARRVEHANVLATLDRGVSEDGFPYIVAEFAGGGDLSRTPLPMPPTQAVSLMAKVARAVQAAHSAGVVHCDLKPANILLTREGEPKLADFGLSRWTSDSDEGSRGNIAFMSPEQFEGRDNALTPPSDIYALGGILIHLLTGSLPHGESAQEISERRAAGLTVPSPGIERDLDRICLKATARNPAHRHHSAGEFAQDLERWLHFEPIPWTQPSVFRRARLHARRHPFFAAALLVLPIILSSILAAWKSSMDAELRHQAAAVRTVRAEIETLKAKARAQLRFLAGHLVDPNGDLQDNIYPYLAWAEFLAESPIIQDDGGVPVAKERSEILKTLIDDQMSKGEGEELATYVAKFARVYALLGTGDADESGPLLDELDAKLLGAFPQDASLRLRMRIMRICFDANRAIASRRFGPALDTSLDRAVNEAQAHGRMTELVRLVEWTQARLARAQQ